jgi:2,3-bisphosphoglycerate-dependent phosphoglycerate mutase
MLIACTMRLILVRHGKTNANVQGILDTHPGPGLNAEGQEQAKRVALRLKQEPITAIYSSDSPRAIATADAIAVYHPTAYRGVDPRFREQYVGVHEGELTQSFHDAWRTKGLNQVQYAPEGGESGVDVAKRVSAAIADLAARHKNETVVVATHSWALKNFLLVALGKTPLDYDAMQHKNTGVTILTDDGGWKAECIACAKHLD